MKLNYFLIGLLSSISIVIGSNINGIKNLNNSTLLSTDISPTRTVSVGNLNCPEFPPNNCGSDTVAVFVIGGDDKCSEFVCQPKGPNVVAIILGSVFGILGFILFGLGVLFYIKRREIKEAGGFFKYFQEKRPTLPTQFSYRNVNGSLSGFSSFSSRNNQSTVSRMPSILLEAKPEKINFQNGLQAAKLVDLDSDNSNDSIIAQVTPNQVTSEQVAKSPIVKDFSEIKPESELQPSQTEFFSFHNDIQDPALQINHHQQK
ncbi:hypothetical protein CONCODRAFT_19558 [Conidiobolus coronatus NRRL 28638]|uniref:Mid2 domain-containing protein n=1 Tax=Conidiobolus coronatus (strain ATCC 28846 / CBS 209.66 / NRRL 28638) TaxID=796925 RepID=A0A137NXW4_CONC2|nr:hypothetical protein CONCODRAFT_19558 [Conidiobolus coronatus NRRL 28638]|eukprot:KXN67511.1 hypothetical protein CONCODRAFT_19558 [Conidiobolus coronatus NRRL 28638]